MLQNPVDYQHPLFKPTRLCFQTPAIKRLSDDLHRWLWTGVRGALLLGSSQVGKTTAMLALRDALTTRDHRPVPSLYVSVPDRDRKTVSSMFRALCYSADLPITQREVADLLSDRFVHAVADTVFDHGLDCALLLVDEVQRLELEQFNAFAEISDKLLRLGVTLLIVFVGNDQECDPMMARVQEPRFAHIRGRFFRQTGRFRGLASLDEVRKVLKQYDTLCYPEDSGPTYTAYFLPEAVAKGWQLADISSDLWRNYRTLSRQYGLSSWGMGDFVISVNALLVDYLPELGVRRLDDDLLTECIMLAGPLANQVQQR